MNNFQPAQTFEKTEANPSRDTSVSSPSNAISATLATLATLVTLVIAVASWLSLALGGGASFADMPSTVQPNATFFSQQDWRKSPGCSR
jgi:hypothetical protein